MSFSHAPPPLAPSTSTSAVEPILSSLLDPVAVPPRLLQLADALLAAKVNATVKREMYELSGALRDEWKVRVGAVKADWMARVVPEELDVDQADEDEDQDKANKAVGEDEEPRLLPTIISDVDGREAMVSRVDKAVEAEFEARVAEAETRIRRAAERKELMEVELLIGEMALDSHSAGFPPAHLPQALQEGVEEALGDQGVDVDAITAASGSVLGLSTGVAGLAVAE